MKSYFDLTGQVAVVTGCSTGLGVQMARALANQGCKIVALARRQEKIDAVAKELHDTYGVETLAVRCDITDTQMVQDAVKAVMDHFGRIDILINNAGTGAVAPAEEITDDQFSNELNIDLFGTFKMAREVARAAMIPAKYGRIINIASMYGLVGNKIAPASPYHAAKGGVVNLTRALACEWGKYGITVNAICPGYFWTPLTKVQGVRQGRHPHGALRQGGRAGHHRHLPGLPLLQLRQRRYGARGRRLYLYVILLLSPIHRAADLKSAAPFLPAVPGATAGCAIFKAGCSTVSPLSGTLVRKGRWFRHGSG